MTRRRAILRVLGAVVLNATAWPVRAQQPRKIPRVALLLVGSRETYTGDAALALFRRHLHDLGHVEGKSILIEERYGDDNAQRLIEVARELVESKPDIIVTPTVAATTAARKATSTIPIVMVHAGNPIGAGLITSLARPGGNVTGLTNMLLGGKQIELIRELVPRAAKLGVLINPTNAGAAPVLANMTDTARSLNIGLVVAEVTRVEDFPKAFSVLRDARPDGLLVMVEALISANYPRVLEFAASARLPASYDNNWIVRQGGLISYGPTLIQQYALAADYVDKILKGAKPADLPVSNRPSSN
jgi:putative ABC transport system substrate-binding protein